jgi:hypothetical protein
LLSHPLADRLVSHRPFSSLSYIKTVLELPGWWARIFRWFEGFDRSLLEQLPLSSKRELLRSYSDIRSSEDHESEGGADQYKSAASQAAGSKNKGEWVAPLRGVAVAVFSEGPQPSEEKDQRPDRALTGSHDTAGASPRYEYRSMGSESQRQSAPGQQPVVVAAEIQAQKQDERREREIEALREVR